MDAGDVARRWMELYNDVEPGTYGSDRFLDLYTPDCRWRESPTALTPGGRSGDLAALREAVALGRELFVDRRQTLHELLVDGDRAVMRHTWSATLKVDLGSDGPLAGSRIQIEIATFLRVARGRIVEATELLSAPTWDATS